MVKDKKSAIGLMTFFIKENSVVTLNDLEILISVSAETEKIEFKEAKTQYDSNKLIKYCAALANEKGGFLVLGVTDSFPRKIVGSQAYKHLTDLNSIKKRIYDTLALRVEVTELNHSDGRVLIFEVPSRPIGRAVAFEGLYLMRAGESTVTMTDDKLRSIFLEGQPDWLLQPACEDASPDEVISLLDTQTYFELLELPYPTNRTFVLERLKTEKLIKPFKNGFVIFNLTAILLAKKLDAFPPEVARKAPRVIIYEGYNKLNTREDKLGNRGYAVGFEGLIDFVHSAAPQNHIVEETLRKDVKMFPRQALRELIANALVHQDFTISGGSVMIEMYNDRIEISNPGLPSIEVKRFIDEYSSRNERLADLMRRFHICEEKGSGIDKVIDAAEFYQLPAPDFRIGDLRTTAIMFAHQIFSMMGKSDRIRACYQHCCLLYVSNRRMSNQSLRQRFGLEETSSATISLIISATKEIGLIKSDDSETASTRYARYLPFWA